MVVPYSKAFERDFEFYLRNRRVFTFSGSALPDWVQSDSGGKSAKEAFFALDSAGKRGPTCEPELLRELLVCKAAVNLQIKLWAEGRADGTLPKPELEEWLEHYCQPGWVLEAVERLKVKFRTPRCRQRTEGIRHDE